MNTTPQNPLPKYSKSVSRPNDDNLSHPLPPGEADRLAREIRVAIDTPLPKVSTLS